MIKAVVYGTESAPAQKQLSGIYAEFEIVKSVELAKNRASGKAIPLDLDDDAIIQFTFSDDTEWIGNALDVQEIYNTPLNTSRSGEALVFEAKLVETSASRGIVSEVIIKALHLLKPKAAAIAAEETAAVLAEAYDKKVMPQPAVFKMDATFQYLPITKVDKQTTPYLLLIHGTLSNTFAAFSDLRIGANPIWNQLLQEYASGILALEHRTLSVSPIQNAIDFLESVEKGIDLDILSHSRGGLVADILAKCDRRNQIIGFSDLELGMMLREDDSTHKLMVKLNKLAQKKQIQIHKVIRVAAPASGTTILSRRLDHFLNVIMNAMGLAIGAQANVLYTTVRLFLLEVVKQKANPEAMAGLYSMVPDSAFQKMLNYSANPVESDLYVIAGDAEAGGSLVDTLKVILANLFYWKANDLVVDSNRMEQGAPRLNGINYFLSKNAATNHFNYFRNQNTCDAILQAAITPPGELANFFIKKRNTSGSRGVLLGLLSMKGVHYEKISGTKPIALLLPGIMGSSLDHNGNPQWIDFRELNRGAIKDDLSIKTEDVSASGVIKKYYDDFAQHLGKTHDVITFPFDWRKSVKHAAQLLAEKIEQLLVEQTQPIQIIAHSMGGLVVRQVMIDFPELWKKLIDKPSTKFIMLGTPWLGSYLIMEVLTGHSSRVKQLAMMDFKNTKRDLLYVFREYPGIFELLPIENNQKRKFWETDFWKKIKEECDDAMVIPLKKELDAFKKYREKVLDFVTKIKEEDLKNVYYIAGHAEQTVYDYTSKSRFLSKKKKLVYLATTHGDSSVTWATGIPSRLPETNLYYTETSHGELANDPKLFDGIVELLQEGKTQLLSKTKPVSRAGEVITEMHGVPQPFSNQQEAADALFGITPVQQATAIQQPKVKVEVINADLKVARYPVMVGHFNNDGVHSAEKALNRCLGGRLMQRYDMGYYPGKIGESEVFFNLNTNPRGAIVCGLGNTQELTHYPLAKTTEMATLKYTMFMRDNYTLARAKSFAEGISFIFIGTGYGRLQVEDSLKGILLGVSNANAYIRQHQDGLMPITEIELINHYESLSSQAYWGLSRLQHADNRFSFELVKGVKSKEGAKKKRAFISDRDDWWHQFNIESLLTKECIKGFAFNSSSGLARIEEEEVHNGLDQVEVLLERMSHSAAWDKRLSKALFELLIPNRFKDIIRNQNNILLKLDLEAAQFPWEMFHDFDSDETPAAVNSGLIRQLLTSEYESLPLRASSNSALIIGDPLYNEENLPQLPAAKKEAQDVNAKLEQAAFETFSLINAEPAEIMLELYTRPYKILHFAGHGLYDLANERVGIAIGDSICINPAMIKQLSYVPEFVFINCCYSGTLDAKDSAYTQSRFKLAANVGTQLINMGVKAIVITGWAVDDAAAATFSEHFYKRMLMGYEFGEAVQMARKMCYQNHGHTNTWGAYQCYGNQHYKFFDLSKAQDDDYDYVLSSQVYIDLENLYSEVKHNATKKKQGQKRLETILNNAASNNLIDGVIREKEALIYDELNEPLKALETFGAVLTLEDANFSLKVLEHFCLLRSHNFSEDAEKRLAELDQVTKLAMIGKTTLRLGVVGNAYKFASAYEQPKKRDLYLKFALDYYTEAFMINSDLYDGNSLDAFSNMVFIAYLLEGYGHGSLKALFERFTTKDPLTYLRDFHKQLDDVDPEDLDISVLLGMTEVSFCLLLLDKDETQEEQLFAEINKRFNETFRLLHSARQIRIEIAQIEFLTKHSAIISEKKINILNKIKRALEEKNKS